MATLNQVLTLLFHLCCRITIIASVIAPVDFTDPGQGCRSALENSVTADTEVKTAIVIIDFFYFLPQCNPSPNTAMDRDNS
jgi:hypothetical protein